MTKKFERNDIVQLANQVFTKYNGVIDYINAKTTLNEKGGVGVIITCGRRDLLCKRVIWLDTINSMVPSVREHSIISTLETMVDELITFRKE